MSTAAPKEIAYDRIRAVEWENGRLKLIDQRILPGKFEHLYLDHLPESAKAITALGAVNFSKSHQIDTKNIRFDSRKNSLVSFVSDQNL